jgi:hypothetical protein
MSDIQSVASLVIIIGKIKEKEAIVKVKVIPRSKRAEERVKQHGNVMELIQVKGDRFLVKSLEPTMKGKEHWLGWFQMETEARMKEIK